jgi:hypothetical protein
MSNKGTVYILSNPAMPGIVKIGITKNLPDRLDSLFNSSVPYKFDCIYACEVEEYQKVETAIHKICDSSRINKKREFFDIDPELVIPTLELLSTKDVTENIEKQLSLNLEPEEKIAREVSSRDQFPSNYKTYKELKDKLIVKDGFRAGYYGIRVAAAHTRKKVPYYKLNGENYYNPDIFIEQAKSEGIFRE